MNIDEKIKLELENEAEDFTKDYSENTSLFTKIVGIYKKSLSFWLIFTTVAGLALIPVMLYAGYQFVITVDLNSPLFYGVLLIILAIVQATFKLWMFNEINKNSTNREIKRLEMTIEQLKIKDK
ncbi:MAG: hypothetical protein MJB14_20265 [Spirochaetes bacterium]|nr:hypothetical protein [Spirochaetota bacterium]